MSRLNYHHLRYFWQVAKTGNLTKAAKNLHVSQSALSSQIHLLEETMNTALFQREGRTLVLTEAGQRALVYAEDIFSKGEELESLLRNGVSATLKTLKIGVLSTMSRNFVESFIEPLIRRSDISYSLHSRRQATLLDGLYNHQFDVALTNIEVINNDQDLIQYQLLARQPVSIIGPPGLNPANEPAETFYKQNTWVLPLSDSPIRSAFNSYCGQIQLQPNIVAEANDMAMLRLLARDSGALAVLPNVVVKDELEMGHLVCYAELPNIYENFFAVTIKRQYNHTLVNELLSNYKRN